MLDRFPMETVEEEALEGFEEADELDNALEDDFDSND